MSAEGESVCRRRKSLPAVKNNFPTIFLMNLEPPPLFRKSCGKLLSGGKASTGAEGTERSVTSSDLLFSLSPQQPSPILILIWNALRWQCSRTTPSDDKNPRCPEERSGEKWGSKTSVMHLHSLAPVGASPRGKGGKLESQEIA